MPQIDFTIFFVFALWIFPIFFTTFYYALVYVYPIFVLWNKIVLYVTKLALLKTVFLTRSKLLASYSYLYRFN